MVLNGIHVTYNDEKDGLDLRLVLGTLGASIDTFDPDNGQFHIGDVAVENAAIRFICAGNTQSATKIYGIDPENLLVDDLSLRAGSIVISDGRMAAEIQHMSFREHGGLDLRELSGEFVVDSVHALLADVTLETAASRSHQDLLLTYASFSDLAKSPGTVGVRANVSESRIAVSDLLRLMPSLPLQRSSDATIRCTFALSGKVRDLQVEHFRLETGDATIVDLRGSLRGLPDMEKTLVRHRSAGSVLQPA